MLFIWKDREGNIKSIEATQLGEKEKMRFGAVIGALLGYGVGGEERGRKGPKAGILEASEESYGSTQEDILDITEAIPQGSAAGILIIEHLWAKSLKRTLQDAGGVLVAQGMLTPELIISVGEELAEAVSSKL